MDEQLLAGIAMLMTQFGQRQSGVDFALTIQADVGNLSRTATFHQGAWRGHDLTFPRWILAPDS